jgi:hypothetical protein
VLNVPRYYRNTNAVRTYSASCDPFLIYSVKPKMADPDAPPQDTSANTRAAVPGGDSDAVPGGDSDAVPGGDSDAVPGGVPGGDSVAVPHAPDFGYPVFFAVFPREFYNAPRAPEVLAETLRQMHLNTLQPRR